MKYEKFTQDDKDMNYFQKNSAGAIVDHRIDTLFWGPEAIGRQTIHVEITYHRLIDGVWDGANTVNVSDDVNANVVQPTGDIRIPTPGIDKPGVEIHWGYDWIRMGENFLSGRPGIAWEADLTNSNSITNGQIAKGQIAIVQTITSTRTRGSHSVFWNENMTEAWTLPDGSSPGITLDNTFPYVPPVPYYVISKSDDSPGQTLDGPGGTYFLDTIQRQDDFTLNLMYQPPGGIWSPVGHLDWGWCGQVSWPGPVAADMNSWNGIYVTAASNADFPTWSHNVNEQNWHRNN